jgi:tetratricopeptide (TPR) repeat protein
VKVHPLAGPQEERAEAIRLAETAAELANDDALALARSAHALAHFGHQYDRATAMVDKAVALNPNLFSAWHARGWIAVNCCEPERAIDSFEISSRLSPRDRAKVALWMGTAFALGQLDRYEEGLALAAKAVEPIPLLWRSWPIFQTQYLLDESLKPAKQRKSC